MCSRKNQIKFNNYIEEKYGINTTDGNNSKISRIVLDTRYRDKVKYPLAGDVIFTLPKLYKRVKSIRFEEMIFPNNSYSIDTNNDTIKYQIQNDPTVYTISIRHGSYDINTLLGTIQNGLNSNTNLQNQLFITNYNSDTQEVRITLYSLINLPENPIIINDENLNVAVVNFPSHNLVRGSSIFLTGIQGTIGGLDNSILNNETFQVLEVIDQDTFSILLPQTAYFDGQYGGDSVKNGKSNPFKFIYDNDSLMGNIGFQLMNSSERVLYELLNRSITSIVNGNTLQIIDHKLNIGDQVSWNGNILNVTAVIDADTIQLSQVSNYQVGDIIKSNICRLTFNNHGIQSGDSVNLYIGDSLNNIRVVARAVSPNTLIVKLPLSLGFNSNSYSNRPIYIFMSSGNVGFRGVQSNHYLSDAGFLEERSIDLSGNSYFFITTPDLQFIDNFDSNTSINGIATKFQLANTSGFLLFDGLNVITRYLRIQDLSELKIVLRYSNNSPVSLFNLDYTIQLVIEEY